MVWSDHEEALFQLRRRRERVLQRFTLVTLAHVVAAIMLETYNRHHRALPVLTIVAFVTSLAGFSSVAVLGARWGINSNAASSQDSADRKAQHARREQAIRDGTWRLYR